MKEYKAGTFIDQGHYRSFQPNPINRYWLIDNMHLLNLLSQADRELGRLDMFSEYVNIELFITMHIAKEATLSSKIEGTQTSMQEAFLAREDISQEKRDDWDEVQNYIEAINGAIKMLESLPFSSRLIRQTHAIILKGVRGEHKLPGEFRTSQNWIGGATLNDAIFVPPVHNAIPELMSDLEKFANDLSNPLPDLLKIALIHYQFETIHPFLDGNGRVGRLLIPLYLVNRGILKKPILYLSDFFERHRSLYYDNLMRVRTHDDITQWFKFFLTGVIETARNGVNTFNNILKLQNETDEKLNKLGTRSGDGKKVVEALYKRPVTDAALVAKVIEKTPASAYKLVAALEGLGILQEITGAQRGRIYVFRQYLNLFSS